MIEDMNDDVSMKDFGFDDLDDMDDFLNDMDSILDVFKKIEIINNSILMKNYDTDILDESVM